MTQDNNKRTDINTISGRKVAKDHSGKIFSNARDI